MDSTDMLGSPVSPVYYTLQHERRRLAHDYIVASFRWNCCLNEETALRKADALIAATTEENSVDDELLGDGVNRRCICGCIVPKSDKCLLCGDTGEETDNG
jgi:hypothetical protein